MADWALSEKAVLDLQEIAFFTGENWGSAQSDAYLEAIYEAIDRIAEYPDIGARRDKLLANSRVMPVRQHRIYYMADRERVLIVRVLHSARDETAELGLQD